ncbi:nicotinate phosphoribosyltransferase, partial [Pseudomonas sp. SIMBA_068]
DSQVFALEVWAKEYRGDLGIALSDVYGMDAFLRDFDMYFCKLFDGARHDSGDPFVWGERLLEHYRKNRVDPRAKTLVFSDSL